MTTMYLIVYKCEEKYYATIQTHGEPKVSRPQEEIFTISQTGENLIGLITDLQEEALQKARELNIQHIINLTT